jgi:GNAT superfamily N-acetyltransferase
MGEIRPLTGETWPALEDLFGPGGASNGCWCMYWRIGSRYKQRPRIENHDELGRLAQAGPPPGLLAFDGEVAVGWAVVAPRAELDWLTRTRFYAASDDLPVWSVPCFYIRRSHRRRGVMGELITAAVDAAGAAGAPALEAYPVDTGVAGHTSNLFPGVAAEFARRGFTETARRQADRPVMRRFLPG